jgi:meiotically up-regulated gene 157 (Mug157) protein
MHESFDPNDPAQYSRSWFAWANSLFAEFVLRWLETPSG